MRLSSLHLRNFRNIAELCLEPGPGFNLLVGPNAQGKTNLVEAVSLLSTGQSFRAADFRDMIRWGAEQSSVEARAECGAGSDDLRVLIDAERKQHLRNGKRAPAASGSRVPTVLFAPEETMLFRGTPGHRRRHLDTVIAQVVPSHRTLIASYERVVRQRNRILQDAGLGSAGKERELAPWDLQLADLGGQIVVQRSAFCGRINERLPFHYAKIASEDGPARIEYLPHDGAEAVSGGRKVVAEELVARLAARRSDELARGITLVGPHRDELDAAIGATKARQHASQGQHRSLVLALKMAEVDLLRAGTGEEPILLLDDVASELDEGRNRHFFQALRASRGQVFITATADADIRLPGPAEAAVFDVRAGRLLPRR
jgi:DNA replication and repair protein RecF